MSRISEILDLLWTTPPLILGYTIGWIAKLWALFWAAVREGYDMGRRVE
jgi:hypothetical protein